MKCRIAPLVIGGLVMSLIGCGIAGGEATVDQEHGIMHEIHGSAEPIEIEEWSDQIALEAQEIARKAVTAYARPDLPDAQWFAQLAPYLSAQAKDTYRQVSNLHIASTEVYHVHLPVKGSSPAIATVLVETDGGDLELLLSRSAKTWQIETITSVEPTAAAS